MTDKKIMEKVLKKINFPDSEDIAKITIINAEYKGIADNADLLIESDGIVSLYAREIIIFSHWFAKAFWGEEQIEIDPFSLDGYDGDCQTCLIKLPAWKWRLQQMILEEQRLKYLEKFL